MRKVSLIALLGLLGLLVPLTAGAAPSQSEKESFVVLAKQGASTEGAKQAIEAAGGTVTEVNDKIGLVSATSSSSTFATDVAKSDAVVGAARNRPLGEAPVTRPADPFAIERMTHARQQAPGAGRVRGKGAPPSPDEPFADLQWDMQMINATSAKSYKRQRGNSGVRVGIIDTGVDGTHPDIAPNLDRSLSRNFTTDIPLIDGPCEDEADKSCTDSPTTDEDGHGTHVAGTIGAPINRLGMAGVAPDVELVNIRAGQDSGYFFLQPTVDALTYAGDVGIDVVNMSFYIDPWLYNCASNPADSPEEQQEQSTVIQATERALAYARARGVTLVSAEGNENTDLGNPTADPTSPDFPPGTERDRTVDNSCVSMPTEGTGVLGISSIGPSKRKAYYSNWGTEQTDLSAPGGDQRDFFGTDRYLDPANTVLAPYPKALAIAAGEVNDDGTPNTPFVLADCSTGDCAYYQYLQGTSMASPHAVGVAALVVAARGKRDPVHGGLTLAPDKVEKVLKASAQKTACPDPPTFTYPDPDLGPEYTATCEGTADFNGFYGAGIVDAFAASKKK